MKKNDWILAAAILGVAALLFGVHFVLGRQNQESVIIYVDGEVYGKYGLSEDQTIQINDTNVLEIRSKEAVMTKADCPDQICVHQKGISQTNESIICLPNKVVVSIEGKEAKELDAVSN